MEGLPRLALPPPKKALFSLPSPSALGYSVWAEKLFEFQRLEEALDAYTECLKLDPSNENALFKRGLVNGLLKNIENALGDLSSVLMCRFLKEARFYKQNILEARNQESKESGFLQAIPESREFFEALSDFQDLGKTVQTAFENLLTEQEYEQFEKDLSGVKAALSSIITEKSDDPAGKEKSASEVKAIDKPDDIIPALEFNKKICLSDVQGLETVKERLHNNIVLPMKRPDLFIKYKKKRSFAILLYGPPGCGKTLLVKALAGETGSHLVAARLHELMDMWTGETEKHIHQIFEEARQSLKKGSHTCIVFLDELDAIGINRSSTVFESGTHRAVNQLLMELDGVEKNSDGLFVIGASNRPWDIDAALKRSGRIGECVYIPAPSYGDRRQLFKYYVGDCASGNLDFDSLAKSADGLSAADVESVVEEAKMRPILREHKTGVESSLCMEDLEAVLADPLLRKGALKEWYVSVAAEMSRGSLDVDRYKPLVDEIKKALRNNSAVSLTPTV